MAEADGTTAASLVQPDSRFDLRQAFLLRQDQLLATLGVGRSVAGHPLAIGDDSELNWRGMLDSILPTRYRVSKGFAVDADGRRSEQIDLLIHDRHFSPVLLDVADYVYIPAEAVFAALEVKQEMNRETIGYAADKVASVRVLRRTSAPILHAGGRFDPKRPQPIIGGLLTMTTGWKPPMGDAFEKALDDCGSDGALDVGCALRSGAFETGQTDSSIARSEAGEALIFFVVTLLKRLQGMASPPAIDYDQYAQALKTSDPPTK
jgi:hypothetical protein